MDEIETLLARLDHDDDIDATRLAVADLMARLITEQRDSLGYWEKHCFAQAIAWLAYNIEAHNRESTAWLRPCVLSLRKALLPANKRDEDYVQHITEIEALTCDQLLADAQALGGRI